MKSFHSQWIAFDYGHFLPWMARMPIPIGRWLARVRGYIYALLGRDWRQFSFDDQLLKARTRQTLNALLPNATKEKIEGALRKRYVMQSLEELEACWLWNRDLRQWPVEYIGLEPVLASIQKHGCAVFVTAHYASSILGTIHLRRLGIPVLGMSSNVVEDSRVHPAIGRFYRKKYAAMDDYLPGGKILDRQGNSRYFAKFVKNGGAVVIVGDLPPDPSEKPLITPFFGEMRGFASGASRLATMAGVPLISFVCEYVDNSYKITFSSPDANPYSMIERQIEENPSAWWAADLLPLLPLMK